MILSHQGCYGQSEWSLDGISPVPVKWPISARYLDSTFSSKIGYERVPWTPPSTNNFLTMQVVEGIIHSLFDGLFPHSRKWSICCYKLIRFSSLLPQLHVQPKLKKCHLLLLKSSLLSWIRCRDDHVYIFTLAYAPASGHWNVRLTENNMTDSYPVGYWPSN